MKKKQLLKYQRRDTLIRGIDKILPGFLQKSSYYGDRSIMDSVQVQDYIAERILSGKPFMAGRFGATELRCIVEYEKKRYGLLQDYSERTYVAMKRNSGFFPTKAEYFDRFGELMQEACSQIDLLGVWFNKLENYYADQYLPTADLTRLESLESYYFDNPWSRALKGKRVLVIHPFKTSIEGQYEKRKFLFENQEVLPDFELVCLQAVQTLGLDSNAGFSSWFEALEYMQEAIDRVSYDVALLGCGAYGFPLAAKIKRDGKQAIHMGGALQILFGIKGKRWDAHPKISKLYNNYWTRPMESEQLKNQNSIENGCYW